LGLWVPAGRVAVRRGRGDLGPDRRPTVAKANGGGNPAAEVEGVMIVLESTVTCPHCGYRSVERMPDDACRITYDCRGCGERLVRLDRDCGVFCSYARAPCPPIQRERLSRQQSL